MTKRVDESEEEEGRDRGRPCSGWLDGDIKVCNVWSLELEDAKAMCLDREQLRNIVNATNGNVKV